MVAGEVPGTAAAVYLKAGHFIPEERLTGILKDLLGAGLSAATLAAMERRKAEEMVKQAPVKHLDETGYRVGGLTQRSSSAVR
jgi:transposase